MAQGSPLNLASEVIQTEEVARRLARERANAAAPAAQHADREHRVAREAALAHAHHHTEDAAAAAVEVDATQRAEATAQGSADAAASAIAGHPTGAGRDVHEGRGPSAATDPQSSPPPRGATRATTGQPVRTSPPCLATDDSWAAILEGPISLLTADGAEGSSHATDQENELPEDHRMVVTSDNMAASAAPSVQMGPSEASRPAAPEPPSKPLRYYTRRQLRSPSRGQTSATPPLAHAPAFGRFMSTSAQAPSEPSTSIHGSAANPPIDEVRLNVLRTPGAASLEQPTMSGDEQPATRDNAGRGATGSRTGRLKRFAQRVLMKTTMPLLPTKVYDSPLLPMRSRRIAAQPLSKIPVAKRVKQRLGTLQGRPAEPAKHEYEAMFTGNRGPSHVEAMRELFPDEDHPLRSRRRRGRRA